MTGAPSGRRRTRRRSNDIDDFPEERGEAGQEAVVDEIGALSLRQYEGAPTVLVKLVAAHAVSVAGRSKGRAAAAAVIVVTRLGLADHGRGTFCPRLDEHDVSDLVRYLICGAAAAPGVEVELPVPRRPARRHARKEDRH